MVKWVLSPRSPTRSPWVTSTIAHDKPRTLTSTHTHPHTRTHAGNINSLFLCLCCGCCAKETPLSVPTLGRQHEQVTIDFALVLCNDASPFAILPRATQRSTSREKNAGTRITTTHIVRPNVTDSSTETISRYTVVVRHVRALLLSPVSFVMLRAPHWLHTITHTKGGQQTV